MKNTSKKLSLRTQTIRALTASEASAVVGGFLHEPAPQGFIMKDSVILPPRR
jgi:hypothetical protein